MNEKKINEHEQAVPILESPDLKIPDGRSKSSFKTKMPMKQTEFDEQQSDRKTPVPSSGRIDF
ncbi:MAG: hypothetical protein LBJ01_09485 [Tannerella sp.]|nr:hypothetical protein [Tannerella sp.]